MQPRLLLLFVMVTMVGYTAAHKFGIGSCPRGLDVVPKLDVDKFIGRWHVLAVAKGYSKCLTMTFNKINDTKLEVTEAREFEFLETVKLGHRNKITAELYIPDASDPARMFIDWPLNPVQATFFVVDTDYTSYALVYECQQWPWVTRASAAILSRGKDLDQETMAMLLNRARELDFDPLDMTPIAHGECLREGEGAITTNINPDTPGGGGGLFDIEPALEFATAGDRQPTTLENPERR